MRGFGPTITMKQIRRERAKALRKRAAIARPDSGLHAASLFLAHIPMLDRSTVALYAPVNSELDPADLRDELWQRGVITALPLIEHKNAPLAFRRYDSTSKLENGRFGVPVPSAVSATIDPDIILVPLLAFTRSGDRLGYGGGYYDRTLAQLRANREILAIGFAYGAQEVDDVDVEPLDQPLDWVITEREAIKTR